jgi:hypothetical protein
MNKKRLMGAVCVCLISSISINSHATGVSGQGTWETTLEARNLDGDRTTAEAYYDTILGITWLADANAAGAQMDWASAVAWAASLNINGINNWRLTEVSPVDGTIADDSLLSYIGTEDRGQNISAPGTLYAGSTASELAHMFYNTLGNLAYCDPTTSTVSTCDSPQPGYGLSNTGPFSNVQEFQYLNSTEWAPFLSNMWYFNFIDGYQGNGGKEQVGYYAWPVHNGDVGIPLATVTIDIKPSKKPENVISLKKDKNLKVAIVGSAIFDALQVNPDTVQFGPSEASPARYKGQDYNRDGFSDLVLTFKLDETGIACDDESAALTGQTFPEPVTDINGNDSFTVEPCP